MLDICIQFELNIVLVLHCVDHEMYSTCFGFYIIIFLQDPIRWNPPTDVTDGYSPTLPHLKGLQNGDTATSAIKQVLAKNLVLLNESATPYVRDRKLLLAA